MSAFSFKAKLNKLVSALEDKTLENKRNCYIFQATIASIVAAEIGVALAINFGLPTFQTSVPSTSAQSLGVGAFEDVCLGPSGYADTQESGNADTQESGNAVSQTSNPNDQPLEIFAKFKAASSYMLLDAGTLSNAISHTPPGRALNNLEGAYQQIINATVTLPLSRCTNG